MSIAYHGSEDLKRSVIERHEAGNVDIKYWIRSEEELGIPESLVCIKYAILGRLSKESAESWPLRFVSAPKVGSDLTFVHSKILYWFTKEEVTKLPNCLFKKT